MHSNRLNSQRTPKKKKRRQLRRAQPKPGTLSMLLLLVVLIVTVIIFMPISRVSPAANVSGTQVSEEVVASGNKALRITEVMSSNRTAFPDESGAFPDWIELTNTGSTPIELEGYGLSDRPDKITYVFPAITLNAGEQIIVFASDENKNTAGTAQHAKFKLSSSGETLYLFGSDGVAFQELTVPAMDRDMSYAWLSDDSFIITQQYSPGYKNDQAHGAARIRPLRRILLERWSQEPSPSRS